MIPYEIQTEASSVGLTTSYLPPLKVSRTPRRIQRLDDAMESRIRNYKKTIQISPLNHRIGGIRPIEILSKKSYNLQTKKIDISVFES